MKKSELEDLLYDSQDYNANMTIELRELKNRLEVDRRELNAQLEYKKKELEVKTEECDHKTRQLERISQSIYTLLQVKYPQQENPFTQPTNTMEVCDVTYNSEDKRMLEFLHGLCNDHRPISLMDAHRSI